MKGKIKYWFNEAPCEPLKIQLPPDWRRRASKLEPKGKILEPISNNVYLTCVTRGTVVERSLNLSLKSAHGHLKLLGQSSRPLTNISRANFLGKSVDSN